MLLIHAGRMMDVRIDLSDVVEISMRHLLAIGSLLVFIEESIEVEFPF